MALALSRLSATASALSERGAAMAEQPPWRRQWKQQRRGDAAAQQHVEILEELLDAINSARQPCGLFRLGYHCKRGAQCTSSSSSSSSPSSPQHVVSGRAHPSEGSGRVHTTSALCGLPSSQRTPPPWRVHRHQRQMVSMRGLPRSIEQRRCGGWCNFCRRDSCFKPLLHYSGCICWGCYVGRPSAALRRC